MYIGLSKTIARFGGFRLGIGMRLNKKNAAWLSFVIMFVAIFQLMWYMMLLCGWMIYAMFYGMYWCIKKIIAISSTKKQKQQIQNNPPQPTEKTISKKTFEEAFTHSEEERKETPPTMSTEMNNTPNENPNNQSPINILTLIRWIVGGLFVLVALVIGFHYSSLFFLASSFLMLPLPFVKTFLQKRNIQPVLVVILSVVLFVVGALTSPPIESTDSTLEETTISVPETGNDNSTKPKETTAKSEETTKPKETSPASNNTTSKEEKVEKVWVSSTGKKYHSKSSCSNMNSPREITLEEAEKQGYTPCSRCH